MKKLMDSIKGKYDQTDIFYGAKENSSVIIKNGSIDTIQSSKSSGYSLRTFKDDKAGFANCNQIDNPEQILQSLDISMKGGVVEKVILPKTDELPKLNNYDEKIEEVTTDTLVDLCEKMNSHIDKQVETEIAIYGDKIIGEKRIINSEGIDYHEKASYSSVYSSLRYPGGAGSIGKSFIFKGKPDFCMDELDKLIKLYKIGEKIVKPESGNMKVLFMPSAMYTLTWRLSIAASANSVDLGTSVLKDKIGKKIFCDKITIYNNPLNDEYSNSSAFDDEGVVNKKLSIVEDGIFKSYYGNINYCKKIGIEPTGNGSRGSWGGKPIGSLDNLFVQAGTDSFDDLIAKMDRGVIVFGALGAHSGNLPNGDFSIGINPCFYVENGKIIGRVKDSMVAGNIYDIMKDNVEAVGKDLEKSYMVTAPPILFNNMNVAIKS